MFDHLLTPPHVLNETSVLKTSLLETLVLEVRVELGFQSEPILPE